MIVGLISVVALSEPAADIGLSQHVLWINTFAVHQETPTSIRQRLFEGLTVIHREHAVTIYTTKFVQEQSQHLHWRLELSCLHL